MLPGSSKDNSFLSKFPFFGAKETGRLYGIWEENEKNNAPEECCRAKDLVIWLIERKT